MTADLTIEATVITQSGSDLTPVGVSIKGTGSIPVPALRAIAQEAIDSFTGSVEAHHGHKVDLFPSFHEQTDDTLTIFPVFTPASRRVEVPC